MSLTFPGDPKAFRYSKPVTPEETERRNIEEEGNGLWLLENMKMETLTCRRCNVPMERGEALENTPTGFPDFIGDDQVCTVSLNGPPKMVHCWKCPKCGHSVK